MLVIFAVIIIGLIGLAWLQYLLFGLPADPSLSVLPGTSETPSGFPIRLNVSHRINLFFPVLIIRSGSSVLVDPPRLYWNDRCAPEKELIHFTPLKYLKIKPGQTN
ncbi:MAG: hypothetical protein WKF35_08605 [Ferruginibacter sp.]